MPEKVEPKQCFVVMGFGLKTDYATGRKLDLDKSYRLLIKPVVESCGLKCIRADEIINSGTIDVPMFQQLLQADVVIADLSSANLNTFYELGVRHALRPNTTVIISESKLPYSFDLNHVKIEAYHHLGEAIDYEEVLRFQGVLGKMLKELLKEKRVDSPVYTFLQDLIPPSLEQKVARLAKEVKESLQQTAQDNQAAGAPPGPGPENRTLSFLVEQAEQAIQAKEYVKAKGLFQSALLISGGQAGNHVGSGSSYMIQRLALATYKSKLPDENTALREATALLQQLDLGHTNDSETVTLAGAAEKRLYEITGDAQHLNAAILFFQRASFLLYNRYNLTNLAFLLNCRAAVPDATEEERIADRIWANRFRRDLLTICENEWMEVCLREHNAVKLDRKLKAKKVTTCDAGCIAEQKFWILANKAEAHLGLGAHQPFREALEAAAAIPHEDWMMDSVQQQVHRLEGLLMVDKAH